MGSLGEDRPANLGGLRRREADTGCGERARCGTALCDERWLLENARWRTGTTWLGILNE